MHHISNRQLFRGLMLAPLAPAIMYVAVSVFLRGYYQDVVLFLFIFSIPSSYIGALALGAPAVLYLRKRRALNIPNVLIAGVITGVFAIYLISFLLGLLLKSHGDLNLVTTLWGAVSGFVAALAFAVASGLHNRSHLQH